MRAQELKETGCNAVIRTVNAYLPKHTVPFVIQSTAAPSTFAEGTAPSTDQPATVVALTLNAAKNASLTKIPEEVASDITGLDSALTTECVSRMYSGAPISPENHEQESAEALRRCFSYVHSYVSDF